MHLYNPYNFPCQVSKLKGKSSGKEAASSADETQERWLTPEEMMTKNEIRIDQATT